MLEAFSGIFLWHIGGPGQNTAGGLEDMLKSYFNLPPAFITLPYSCVPGSEGVELAVVGKVHQIVMNRKQNPTKPIPTTFLPVPSKKKVDLSGLSNSDLEQCQRICYVSIILIYYAIE